MLELSHVFLAHLGLVLVQQSVEHDLNHLGWVGYLSADVVVQFAVRHADYQLLDVDAGGVDIVLEPGLVFGLDLLPLLVVLLFKVVVTHFSIDD